MKTLTWIMKIRFSHDLDLSKCIPKSIPFSINFLGFYFPNNTDSNSNIKEIRDLKNTGIKKT